MCLIRCKSVIRLIAAHRFPGDAFGSSAPAFSGGVMRHRGFTQFNAETPRLLLVPHTNSRLWSPQPSAHGVSRMRATEHHVADSDEQLRGDFAHLGKLRSSIRRAVETVQRGQRAYADSLELIARLE